MEMGDSPRRSSLKVEGEGNGATQVHLHQCMQHEQKTEGAIVWQANYDLVTITEMWWDQSHDWTATIYGYKLSRMDWQLRRGGGVALY